jgi:hypothetical protein
MTDAKVALFVRSSACSLWNDPMRAARPACAEAAHPLLASPIGRCGVEHKNGQAAEAAE